MALTPTHRPTREWPLLVLALALVCALCVPLWQWTAGEGVSSPWQDWSAGRFGRLLLGPAQIAAYCCFAWAAFILLGRYLEVRRQRRAFGLGLLPTDAGARILPEDARPLQRKVDQLASRGGPYILANMVRLALGKYAVSRSSHEVSETVRTQAEVDQGRLVASMATVHYLAWAIPTIGFLGTVLGMAGGLAQAGKIDDEHFSELVAGQLSNAFDCTLVALVLSLGVMFLLHAVQREEEALVIDCQQYCLEHLVNRLYDLEPVAEFER
ncbi:MAG TPA: MotA/TolQ/ExbB proton channel family protein [Gemmataceae bacterium]|nr:MotA/TolQ/ExbB proton channel family protein [Gemmataceae bacterium]